MLVEFLLCFLYLFGVFRENFYIDNVLVFLSSRYVKFIFFLLNKEKKCFMYFEY